MAFLNSLNISGTGMTVQKLRMDVIAQNISNASTTRTANGEPYRRKLVVFGEKTPDFSAALAGALKTKVGGGVDVIDIINDQENFKLDYNPSHPDANANGYVRMPNVDTTQEMVDMISATRSFTANITAFNALKSMAVKALEIGK